jgi:hypothetical protein
MKAIYIVPITIGLGIIVYLYGFNFDHMSETQLVNSIILWYAPIIFGLYGLASLRIKTSADETDTMALKHMFFGKDNGLLLFGIILILISGVVGFLLFAIPVSIYKLNNKRFDVYVAITGSLVWLILLVLFFLIIWPSL